jgi:hypothetical protein
MSTIYPHDKRSLSSFGRTLLVGSLCGAHSVYRPFDHGSRTLSVSLAGFRSPAQCLPTGIGSYLGDFSSSLGERSNDQSMPS